LGQIYHSVRRHLRKVAVLEGGITVASVVLGEVAGEAAHAIIWDPDPNAAGRHIINYGWPFVTKQMIDVVNSAYKIGGHISWLTFPEKFGYNAGFYGALSFVLFNVLVLGVYELFNWNKNRKIKM